MGKWGGGVRGWGKKGEKDERGAAAARLNQKKNGGFYYYEKVGGFCRNDSRWLLLDLAVTKKW